MVIAGLVLNQAIAKVNDRHTEQATHLWLGDRKIQEMYAHTQTVP